MNKNGADYICDGVDDQIQIQQALDTGKQVVLSDGNFSLSANLNFNNPINLTGQGSTTVLTFSSGAVIRAYYTDGITMSKMTFRGIAATSTTSIFIQHSSNISITNCTFDGMNVQITGGTAPNSPETIDSDNVLVQYCTFKNSPSVTNQCFALGNTATHFRILDNYFHNVAGSAIDVSCSPYPVVSGNVIDGAYNSWFSGIYSEGGLGVQITNNTIRNCFIGYAIMESEGWYGHGVGGNGTIANNTITYCYGGVAIIGTPGMIVSDNTITNSAVHGIYVDEATIVNNPVVYDPHNEVVQYNTISGFGLVNDCLGGIWFSHTTYSQFNNNYIDGKGNPKARTGIVEYSPDSDYNTIAGNTIAGVPTGISTSGQHTVVTLLASTPTLTPMPWSLIGRIIGAAFIAGFLFFLLMLSRIRKVTPYDAKFLIVHLAKASMNEGGKDVFYIVCQGRMSRVTPHEDDAAKH